MIKYLSADDFVEGEMHCNADGGAPAISDSGGSCVQVYIPVGSLETDVEVRL